MKTIKITSLFLSLLLLISCGGKSSNSENTSSELIPSEDNIIFPDHLPKVNPNLSTNNQSGIWMIYRINTSKTDTADDDSLTGILEREIISNELLLLPDDGYDDHILQECTEIGITPDFDLVIAKEEKHGYSLQYRSNITENYGEAGRIDTYFLSGHKIYGKGWKNRPYTQNNEYKNYRENVEFFAIKISDEANFANNNEIKYSGFLTSDSSSERYIDPLCIGLQKHNYSSKTTEEETGQYHFQYFTFFGKNSPGFVIYDGKSSNSESYKSEDNQLIGVQQPFYSNSRSVDNFCYSSDLECVNKYVFQSAILQNDASGISFTAKLTGNEDLNNEVLIDTKISAIIHPFESAEIHQK